MPPKATAENNMAVSHPGLAAQFHPTRNGDLTPEMVLAGTGKKLWWKCSAADDHEWEASGDSRKRGSGCPFCAGQAVGLDPHPEFVAVCGLKVLWWVGVSLAVGVGL